MDTSFHVTTYMCLHVYAYLRINFEYFMYIMEIKTTVKKREKRHALWSWNNKMYLCQGTFHQLFTNSNDNIKRRVICLRTVLHITRETSAASMHNEACINSKNQIEIIMLALRNYSLSVQASFVCHDSSSKFFQSWTYAHVTIESILKIKGD